MRIRFTHIFWQEKVKKWSEVVCITHPLTFWTFKKSEWLQLKSKKAACAHFLTSYLFGRRMASCTSSHCVIIMHIRSTPSLTREGQEVEWIVWLLNSQKSSRSEKHAPAFLTMKLWVWVHINVHSHLLTREGQEVEWRNDVPSFLFLYRSIELPDDYFQNILHSWNDLLLATHWRTYKERVSNFNVDRS